MLTMQHRLYIAPLIALSLLLALAMPASAEVRTLRVQDPPDAVPTISGVPDNPDISEVSAAYDSAGSLSITVSFYNALSGLDTSQNFTFWGSFTVSTGSERSWQPSFCSPTFGTGDLSGQHHIYSGVGWTFFDRASVTGYSGYLPFTRSAAEDQRSITVSASSPALAGRDYRCLEYVLRARTRSTISNPYSEWSEACGCWYVSPNLDWIGGSLDLGYGIAIPDGGVWFDGFAPAPAAPPPPPPPAAPRVITPACKQARVKVHRDVRRLRRAKRRYKRHGSSLRLLLIVQRSETRLEKSRAIAKRRCR